MLTALETTTYREPKTSADDAGEKLPIGQLPKSAWVGAALFVINLTIGIGMLVTPDMQTDVYGHDAVDGRGVYAGSSKPSPFAEVVDTTKHKVRLAAKLRPVVFEAVPPMEGQPAAVETASTSLDIPRASRAYQLDMPVRTENAVYGSNSRVISNASVNVYDTDRHYWGSEPGLHQTTNVTPRVSERENKFVVIN